MATLRHLAALRNKGAKIFFGHDADLWRTIPRDQPIS
jgi:hypothetical protein